MNWLWFAAGFLWGCIFWHWALGHAIRWVLRRPGIAEEVLETYGRSGNTPDS